MIDYIALGDCVELLAKMESNSVDVVFTSPPYNRQRNDAYNYYNDTLSDYFGMLAKVTDQCLRVAKDKVIINLQTNFYNKRDVYRFFGEYADKIAGVIIWTKTNPKPVRNYRESDNTRSVTNAHEYFIVLTNKSKQFRCYGDENTLSWISTSVNRDCNNKHRAVMKKDVCGWFIKKFTKKGGLFSTRFLALEQRLFAQ